MTKAMAMIKFKAGMAQVTVDYASAVGEVLGKVNHLQQLPLIAAAQKLAQRRVDELQMQYVQDADPNPRDPETGLAEGELIIDESKFHEFGSKHRIPERPLINKGCQHRDAKVESWNGSVYKICYDCETELEPTKEEIEAMHLPIEYVDDPIIDECQTIPEAWWKTQLGKIKLKDGGKMIIASSPHPTAKNWFYKEFCKQHNEGFKQWVIHQSRFQKLQSFFAKIWVRFQRLGIKILTRGD